MLLYKSTKTKQITRTLLVSTKFSFQILNFAQNGNSEVNHHATIPIKLIMNLLRFAKNPGLESSFNGLNIQYA
jgi:hypothetical protein